MTATIPITTVRMPTLGPVMQMPHMPTATTPPVMVITATPPATMPMPPLMLIVRQKLPGTLQERGIMPAMPMSNHTMSVNTMSMDTTTGINLPAVNQVIEFRTRR